MKVFECISSSGCVYGFIKGNVHFLRREGEFSTHIFSLIFHEEFFFERIGCDFF